MVVACLLLQVAAAPSAAAAEGPEAACVEAQAMNDAVIDEARGWPQGDAPRADVSAARSRLCAAYQLCPTYAELLHNLDITSALLGDVDGALRYCED